MSRSSFSALGTRTLPLVALALCACASRSSSHVRHATLSSASTASSAPIVSPDGACARGGSCEGVIGAAPHEQAPAPQPRVILRAPPPGSADGSPRGLLPPSAGQPRGYAPMPPTYAQGASAPTQAAPPSDEPAPNAATLDPDAPMPKRSVTTHATLQLGRPANVMLDARSDLFSASLAAADAGRGGVPPSTITLAPGGGAVVVGAARGLIGCESGAHWGPDGGSCASGRTHLTPADRVSGIAAHERSLFIAGVFLGDTSGPVPEALDFSDAALGRAFPELRPKLGQSFFIGDGLTGTGAGTPQRFVVPPGATRLYVGFADGSAFQGQPGWYHDNTGSVAFQVTQHAP